MDFLPSSQNTQCNKNNDLRSSISLRRRPFSLSSMPVSSFSLYHAESRLLRAEAFLIRGRLSQDARLLCVCVLGGVRRHSQPMYREESRAPKFSVRRHALWSRTRICNLSFALYTKKEVALGVNKNSIHSISGL